MANEYASLEESPEQWAEYKDTKRLLNAFIKSLEGTDKRILAMRYAGSNMTFADIAQILNMTESSVKKRFYRMRDRFKSLYIKGERSEEYGKL